METFSEYVDNSATWLESIPMAPAAPFVAKAIRWAGGVSDCNETPKPSAPSPLLKGVKSSNKSPGPLKRQEEEERPVASISFNFFGRSPPRNPASETPVAKQSGKHAQVPKPTAPVLDLDSELEVEKCGVGLSFINSKDGPLISEIMPGSAAWKAKPTLEVGDRLLFINGNSVRFTGIDGISAQIDGRPGSTVEIAVEKSHSGKKHIWVTLERYWVGGVGIRFRIQNGQTIITGVEADGAAARSGKISSGDVITAINDKECGGLSNMEIIGLAAGPSGSTVILDVLSPGSKKAGERVILRRDPASLPPESPRTVVQEASSQSPLTPRAFNRQPSTPRLAKSLPSSTPTSPALPAGQQSGGQKRKGSQSDVKSMLAAFDAALNKLQSQMDSQTPKRG